MDWDPLSVEAIEWSLWCTLMCQCEKCNAVLDLSKFDELNAENPIEWSKVVAPLVKSKGWSAPAEFQLLCPVCTNQTFPAAR